MLVQNVMQTNVVTVTPKTTLPEAMRLVQQRRIRHLPVLEDGELVGIVSDRDLKRAMAPAATTLDVPELNFLLDQLSAGEIMTRAVITVAPTVPVEEAARLMVTERISALPVIEGGRMVGIVTETDVLELLVRAMGIGQPSSRLDVALGDRASALAEVVQILERVGAPVWSIVTLVDRAGVKEAAIRLATINPGPAIDALAAKGFEVRESWRG